MEPSSDSDSDESAKLESISNSCISNYGLAWDTNRPWRRRCEDTHVAICGYNLIKSDCFFAIYDGHAGKNVSRFCEEVLHVFYAKNVSSKPGVPTPTDLAYLKKNPVTLPTKPGESSSFPSAHPGEPHQLKMFRMTYAQVDREVRARSINWGGACAVTCYIQEKDSQRSLYTANCGDCRAVLIRGGKALRVSFDHTLKDENEVKRIKAAKGTITQGRINNTIAVPRSLGDLVMKNLIISSPFTRVDILTKDDSHLILACDGVWDVLEDQAVADIILGQEREASGSTEGIDYELLARKIINAAKENKSRDNLSVLIVKL